MTPLVIFLAFVAGPAAVAFLFFEVYFLRVRTQAIRAGDFIVYRKQKVSTHPGARAREIHPAEHGDFYDYLVNKYWTVDDVLDDGRIVAKTRRDKRHYLNPEDPNFRKARLTERLRFRDRFPKLGR